VSGQENPIDTIYSNKFYEVAPNVTLTMHVYSRSRWPFRRRPGRNCPPRPGGDHQGRQGSGRLVPERNP